MKKRRKLWTLVLLILFLFSTGRYLWYLRETAASQDSHSLAKNLASGEMSPETSLPKGSIPQPTEPMQTVWVPMSVEDSHLDTLLQLRLDSLRQTNPDVVGWIWIPDTPVDYPVVQGSDNSFYLSHTWDKQRNGSGAIFLEATNQKDMTEFHTIVYGHNMRNGSMFGSLRKYSSREYWQTHPYVYLLTETGAFRYEIYASYLARVDGMTYQLKQQKEETREAFAQFTKESSEADTGITPAPTDRILTLSTCSGMGYTTRWVIHARLPMIELTQ